MAMKHLSVQQPKYCDKHGNKNEVNSPKNVNSVLIILFNITQVLLCITNNSIKHKFFLTHI